MPVGPIANTSTKAAMTGKLKSPISAVKISSAATPLSLKKRSTRYLSIWVEAAHRTGPLKAKRSHDIRRSAAHREDGAEAAEDQPPRVERRLAFVEARVLVHLLLGRLEA